MGKKYFIPVLLLFVFSIVFCPLQMVHADETEKIIDIEYVSEEGDTFHCTEENATRVGSYESGTTNGSVYLIELPAGASVTNITSSLPTIQTRGTTMKRSWQSVSDGSYKNESYYVTDSDFSTPVEISGNGFARAFVGVIFDNGYQLPTEKVKGFAVQSITSDNLTYHRFFVQISTDTSSEVINKEALEVLINHIPSSGYYTEGDIWNGKQSSTNGFWTDLQALKEEMQAVYDSTSYTQAQIDAKVEEYTPKVEAAINTLIPTTQVLPVKIHNALETIKLPADAEEKYSTASIEKFNTAREACQAAYDTLFDSDGNAITDESIEKRNTADRQEEIDAVADALQAANDDLLGKTSEKDIVKWKEASEWVASQSIVEADYTEESVSALKAALAKVNAIEEEHSDITELLGSKKEYQEYTSAIAESLAAYYQLENLDEITVHVRIVDNYGIIHPEYAIDDPDMANFNDDVKLSFDKTIQGLFTEGKLNTEPKNEYEKYHNSGGLDDRCEHAHTYVYINGKLAIPALQADPTEMAKINPTAGHMDTYFGEDPTFDGPWWEGKAHPLVEERFPVLKNAVHNGDDIVILRTRAPYYKGHSVDNTYCITSTSITSITGSVMLSLYYDDSFGFLKIDDSEFTEGSVETRPGEDISINVKLNRSNVITGKPEDAEDAGSISVLASAPFSTKDNAAKASEFSNIPDPEDEEEKLVTDADGKATFSFDKEGWYRVAVMDMNQELPVAYSILHGDPDPGNYPYLRVADYMLIHVSMDDEFDELAEPKKAAEDAFNALEAAETAYEDSKSAATEAAATPGDEAVEAAEQAVTDAESVVKAAEDAKAAAEAYLEKVAALAEKKDQMSDAHKAEIEEALTKAEADVKKAEDAIASGKEELADAKEVLDKAETKAALKKYQEEIAALKAENAEQQEKINDLLAANETAQEEISALKAANTASKEEISDLKDEIAANEAKIAELEEQGGDNEELIAELQAANETAQGKINELTETITANQTEIETLKEQIAENQEEIQKITAEDPLAAARKEAIDKVNKYLEDNAKNILGSDTDSAELAALKALVTIKDAASAEEITKATDAAIAKIDEKIAAKKAADEKAAKIKAAKAQTVKGLKVKVKKTKATVSWKKNTSVTGYEVYSSLKKKSGYKKVKTLKKNTKIKFVNKKLKKGKKYFYKVRTFTTIDGKAYYGKYTKVKATKKIK